MKKVGIITLSGNDNYGNKLQNYALKKYIEKLNFDVHTIWIDLPTNKNIMGKIARILANKIKLIKNIKKIIKIINIKRFSKQYLNNDYRIRLTNNLKKIDRYYDYFVVGSDQVWNYKYINDYDLYFMKKIESGKCFSYAASFGTYNIPDNYYDNYEEGLKHLKYISVRENRGKELVKEISARNDADVLVDPTMLLTMNEWKKLSRKPKIVTPSKYIFAYFLGNINDNKANEINKICEEYNCELINIMDTHDKFYSCNPQEFLYLISNALYVFTDSFHACVFSILFDKTFVIFERDYCGVNMNSRIDTLLSKMKISNRIYNGKNITSENLNHDYTEAYKILENERKKSKNFLEKALDISKVE